MRSVVRFAFHHIVLANSIQNLHSDSRLTDAIDDPDNYHGYSEHVPADGRFDRRTGAGHVGHGDYARAQAAGVTCVPLLVETFGGLSTALMHELRAAAEWRSNKLTSSEYDETT